MRPSLVSLQVGLPHLLIWIGVVVLLVASLVFFRRWPHRHPKDTTRRTSYSGGLKRRFAESRMREPWRAAGRPSVNDRMRDKSAAAE